MSTTARANCFNMWMTRALARHNLWKSTLMLAGDKVPVGGRLTRSRSPPVPLVLIDHRIPG
jgi:hypothetical protein